MTYRPHTIIPGFKLGPQYSSLKVIAVPKQKLHFPLLVLHKTGTMTITELDIPLKEIEFEDKFGRGKYTLVYYTWQPTEQLGLMGGT